MSPPETARIASKARELRPAEAAGEATRTRPQLGAGSVTSLVTSRVVTDDVTNGLSQPLQIAKYRGPCGLRTGADRLRRRKEMTTVRHKTSSAAPGRGGRLDGCAWAERGFSGACRHNGPCKRRVPTLYRLNCGTHCPPPQRPQHGNKRRQRDKCSLS